MRIVVTGGSGFLGSRTIHFLAAAGHEVLCMDTAPAREPGVEWRVCDLRRREFAYEGLRGADVVIHLANHSNAQKTDAQTVLSENVAMNANVFQAASELGVRRVIFSSSVQAISGGPLMPGSEYPPPEKRKIGALPYAGDSPARAGNAYGQSKIFGEELLAYHVERREGALEGVSVRFPFISRDPRRLRRWFKPDIEHHAAELFSWLWIDDAARLLQACVDAKELPGHRIYFPAGPLPPDWPDAESLAQTYFARAPRRRPGEALRSLIDITAVTAELGWSPTPWSAFGD
jgi:nucleoside-diphosphate-sugar epimerase